MPFFAGRTTSLEGRLHCTRFSRRYFEDLVTAAGMAVDRFVYGHETDGQSHYVLRKVS